MLVVMPLPAQDFPTLVSSGLYAGELSEKDTVLKDTNNTINGYVPIYQAIEG